MVVNSEAYELAEEVLRLRISQVLINELNKDKRFKIPIHLAMGHEAIAVAVSSVMGDADRLLLTHRNVHYNLARQKSLRAEIDEYLLSENGLGQGRYGAMNLMNPSAGIVYTSSILANNLPVAAGIGLAGKIHGKDGVTIVVTGDGAMEEGAFYETLVFFKTFEIPALVIIENNEWSLATRISERRARVDLKQVSEGIGASFTSLSGNDVIEYRDKINAVREDALRLKSPCVIEVALTTLGDWRLINDQNPDGKFINYHAGVAPDVAPSEWPVIRESHEDPVHVLANRFAMSDLVPIAERLSARLKEDLV
tara:strand:+ start:8847 stop:9776 length:930 start_codon:yes stop_codon:yes gene_type:complete